MSHHSKMVDFLNGFSQHGDGLLYRLTPAGFYYIKSDAEHTQLTADTTPYNTQHTDTTPYNIQPYNTLHTCISCRWVVLLPSAKLQVRDLANLPCYGHSHLTDIFVHSYIHVLSVLQLLCLLYQPENLKQQQQKQTKLKSVNLRPIMFFNSVVIHKTLYKLCHQRALL